MQFVSYSQVAKVYVSVYGDKDGIDRALKGLVEKQRYVRSGIAKRMSLRLTPDIRFISDEALERGTEVGFRHPYLVPKPRPHQALSGQTDVPDGFEPFVLPPLQSLLHSGD